ncbi:glycoside hydrolase family 13 protein [Dactylosporangium roseum]|uniref:Alpha-amylase n=1 Tax=Dactylosporangium roseum TaxID=47989 RepID=A0ABY5Z5W2_9ACTN|nr:glycoside hydrolase family 13 protein [Dactylosporangium roseum]UWZ37434.1 glycoside hydrolase family 13 protein [Dactylosporangium roseum]
MEWWRSAVIYQVYPRSFADSNGDGVGDLPGITGRLSYLADLGVDAVWLSPFYRSPMVDGGYDVADYCAVDPIFGTLRDFDDLLAEAHRIGLRVIVDIVPNHSSDLHPWFQQGLRDRYIFAEGRGDGPPNDWQSLFGGPAWTRVADGHWYLHLFDPGQPDLNWRNPQVGKEFDAILRFWLDRGVDGFRVDVAHGMVKAEGLPDVAGQAVLPYFDQEEVHEIYRGWRRILDSYPGQRMAVAEVFDSTPERVARYVAGDELHQAFNFDFLEAPWEPATLRRVIDASIEAAGLVGAPATWVLSNHDRQRHVTRFGDGVVGLRRARAAALLMLGLPGSAYIYQGEELGLSEVLDLPDELRLDPQRIRSGGKLTGRDGCRVPLPWERDTPPFGFGPSERAWLPMPREWAASTVEAQRDDPDSMLNLYRRALSLRRPAHRLAWRPAPEGVLCFETEQLVVAANLSGSAVPLPGPPILASSPVDELLPPDTTVWLPRDTTG